MTSPDTAPGDAFEQMVDEYGRRAAQYYWDWDQHRLPLDSRSALVAEYRRVEQERDKAQEMLNWLMQQATQRLQKIMRVESQRDAALQQVQALQKEAGELRGLLALMPEQLNDLEDYLANELDYKPHRIEGRKRQVASNRELLARVALATGSAGETQHE